MFVPNFKILSQEVPEKFLTEKKVDKREKEKWKNKEDDKKYVADSLIHSTT